MLCTCSSARRVDAVAPLRGLERARGGALVASLLLNAASCCARAGRHGEARWACSEALAAADALLPPAGQDGDADALRAKALFRRAAAAAAEGTAADDAAAARDAAAAAVLAPRDAQARAHLGGCADAMRAPTMHPHTHA